MGYKSIEMISCFDQILSQMLGPTVCNKIRFFYFSRKQKTAEVTSHQKKPQVLEKKAAAPSSFFGSGKIKKESKAADFFGAGHVTKQSNPEVKKTDKSKAPEIKKTDKPKEPVDLDFSDDELFDDDEFNQTIEELESGSKKPKVHFSSTSKNQ